MIKQRILYHLVQAVNPVRVKVRILSDLKITVKLFWQEDGRSRMVQFSLGNVCVDVVNKRNLHLVRTAFLVKE